MSQTSSCDVKETEKKCSSFESLSCDKTFQTHYHFIYMHFLDEYVNQRKNTPRKGNQKTCGNKVILIKFVLFENILVQNT